MVSRGGKDRQVHWQPLLLIAQMSQLCLAHSRPCLVSLLGSLEVVKEEAQSLVELIDFGWLEVTFSRPYLFLNVNCSHGNFTVPSKKGLKLLIVE